MQDYIQQDEEEAAPAQPMPPVPEADVLLYGTKGIVIKTKTVNQRTLVESAAQHDLVFAIGPAGTGKTYISVALAVKALKDKKGEDNHYPASRRSRRKPGFSAR